MDPRSNRRIYKKSIRGCPCGVYLAIMHSSEVNDLHLGIWMSIQLHVEYRQWNRQRDPERLAQTPGNAIQLVFTRSPIELQLIVDSRGGYMNVEEQRGWQHIDDPDKWDSSQKKKYKKSEFYHCANICSEQCPDISHQRETHSHLWERLAATTNTNKLGNF